MYDRNQGEGNMRIRNVKSSRKIVLPCRPSLSIPGGCVLLGGLETGAITRDRNQLRSQLSPKAAINNTASHQDNRFRQISLRYRHSTCTPLLQYLRLYQTKPLTSSTFQTFVSPLKLSHPFFNDQYCSNFECIKPAHLKLKCTT